MILNPGSNKNMMRGIILQSYLAPLESLHQLYTCYHHHFTAYHATWTINCTFLYSSQAVCNLSFQGIDMTSCPGTVWKFMRCARNFSCNQTGVCWDIQREFTGHGSCLVSLDLGCPSKAPYSPETQEAVFPRTSRQAWTVSGRGARKMVRWGMRGGIPENQAAGPSLDNSGTFRNPSWYHWRINRYIPSPHGIIIKALPQIYLAFCRQFLTYGHQLTLPIMGYFSSSSYQRLAREPSGVLDPRNQPLLGSPSIGLLGWDCSRKEFRWLHFDKHSQAFHPGDMGYRQICPRKQSIY